MPSQLWIVLIFMALNAACRATVCTQMQDRNETGVRAFEALWLQALTQNDVTLLKCLLDKNFRDTTWHGEVRDRNQALNAASAPRDFKQSVVGERVRILDRTALIWGVNIIRASDGRFITKISFTDVLTYAGSH